MAALIVAPDPWLAKEILGDKWVDVLTAAGLVDSAWRPSRGTYCTAADGHRCRSLGERRVDDWLTTHGLEHEPEPRYPGSSRRADWRLADGTFIEYAGMMDHGDYAASIAAKQNLAKEAGVRLIIVLPEDLRSLDALLGAGVLGEAVPSD